MKSVITLFKSSFTSISSLVIVSPGWKTLLSLIEAVIPVGTALTVIVYVAVLVTPPSIYVTVTVFSPLVDIFGEETLVGVTVASSLP